MRKFVSACVFMVSVIVVAACGSDAAIGDSCEEIGKSKGECESGGVCSKDTDGATRCLQVCNAVTDCPSGRACMDAEGTPLKACRISK